MLPALTVRAARLSRRVIGAVLGVVLLSAAAALELSVTSAAIPAPVPLADRLPASSWGFVVPTSWLATPVVGIMAGDRIDILALRPGGASASAIAFDLEVVAVDERQVILAVAAEDATALALARASGQLIFPLLRSTR